MNSSEDQAGKSADMIENKEDGNKEVKNGKDLKGKYFS